MKTRFMREMAKAEMLRGRGTHVECVGTLKANIEYDPATGEFTGWFEHDHSVTFIDTDYDQLVSDMRAEAQALNYEFSAGNPDTKAKDILA